VAFGQALFDDGLDGKGHYVANEVNFNLKLIYIDGSGAR
jgi:hypothetical protein